MAHARECNIDKVETMFEQLIQSKHTPTSWGYASLLTVYASTNDIKGCYSIMNDMGKRGVRPEVRTYEITLRAFRTNKHFKSADEWRGYMESTLQQKFNARQVRRSGPQTLRQSENM